MDPFRRGCLCGQDDFCVEKRSFRTSHYILTAVTRKIFGSSHTNTVARWHIHSMATAYVLGCHAPNSRFVAAYPTRNKTAILHRLLRFQFEVPLKKKGSASDWDTDVEPASMNIIVGMNGTQRSCIRHRPSPHKKRTAINPPPPKEHQICGAGYRRTVWVKSPAIPELLPPCCDTRPEDDVLSTWRPRREREREREREMIPRKKKNKLSAPFTGSVDRPVFYAYVYGRLLFFMYRDKPFRNSDRARWSQPHRPRIGDILLVAQQPSIAHIILLPSDPIFNNIKRATTSRITCVVHMRVAKGCPRERRFLAVYGIPIQKEHRSSFYLSTLIIPPSLLPTIEVRPAAEKTGELLPKLFLQPPTPP